MVHKLIFLLLVTVTLLSCSNSKSNPERWTDNEVNAWFEKQEWLGGWNVQPDASVDKRSLAINYFKNRRYWDEAFQYLKNTDLRALPVSDKHELDGKHILVAVSEYTTRDKSETRYESHRKYIDIQHIIKGEELIGLTTQDKAKITIPYSEEKDIAFYQFEGGKYLKATPENFMIFFPKDLHRPMLKVNENARVKKIVIKILIE